MTAPGLARFVEWLSLDIRDVWALFLAWLRRPRHQKAGALAPVIVTADGVVVPSIDHVPLRSTKADAKRQALAWARTHWQDPTLTWGQARKRIKRLEARARDGKLDARAVAAIEAVQDV
jgi:hypothetical protein